MTFCRSGALSVTNVENSPLVLLGTIMEGLVVSLTG